MANKPLDTELLDRAIVFAVRAHAGTERRGKGFPYIVHLLEAVEIVATMTPSGTFSTPRTPRTTSGTIGNLPKPFASFRTLLPTKNSNSSSIRCSGADLSHRLFTVSRQSYGRTATSRRSRGRHSRRSRARYIYARSCPGRWKHTRSLRPQAALPSPPQYPQGRL